MFRAQPIRFVQTHTHANKQTDIPFLWNKSLNIFSFAGFQGVAKVMAPNPFPLLSFRQGPNQKGSKGAERMSHRQPHLTPQPAAA